VYPITHYRDTSVLTTYYRDTSVLTTYYRDTSEPVNLTADILASRRPCCYPKLPRVLFQTFQFSMLQLIRFEVAILTEGTVQLFPQFTGTRHF